MAGVKQIQLRIISATLSLVAIVLLPHTALSAEETLPPELAFIADVISDEEEAVEAVRRFDAAQIALSDWDMETAQELGTKGEVDDADARVGSSRRRIELIDLAYREILDRYPENARALTYHGELLYDYLGDQATAIKNWRMASSFDETLSTPHNNLGLHYNHTGNYQMGLRELDRALELDEDHADYHFNIAQIYLINGPQVEKIRRWDKKKIYREAMKHSKLAAELAPDDYHLQQDYAVNFFAAKNFGVDADWNKAAEAWAAARANARDSVEEFYTWLNEARVWIEHEDPAQAEPCLMKALSLAPDSGVATRLLEQVQKQGD